jgi:predicted HTH domain antitoxin
MKTITLKLPEKVDLDTIETVKFLAAKLYESGKLSIGQAAELTGLSKMAFSEILGDYGVSLFNYPAKEIVNDTAKI